MTTKDVIVLTFDCAMLLSVAAVACYAAIRLVQQQRSADRENARRRQQYQDDCDRARRDGLPPPFPPNLLRCR